MSKSVKNYIISGFVDTTNVDSINYTIQDINLSSIDNFLSNNFKNQQCIGYVKDSTGQIVANVLKLTLYTNQDEPAKYVIYAFYADGSIDQDYTGTISPLS